MMPPAWMRDSVTGWNAAHPTHLKGSDGKWADTPGGGGSKGFIGGMPDSLVSIAVAAMGGAVTASARHDGDGKATLSANGRSVDLDDRDLNDLRRLMIAAQYGDDRKAADDGVYRLSRHTLDQDSGSAKTELLISLRPVEGAYVTETGRKVSSVDDPDAAAAYEEIYNAEFDMVVGESPDGDFDDEPMTRIGIKELFTGRNSAYDSLERVTTARRIDTGNGPTDVFSPRPGAVGLRMKDDNGDPTEVVFNARDVRRLDAAISEVLYGPDGEDDLTLPSDEQTTVETSGGPVEVRFKGQRPEGGDWEGTLLVVPHNAPWGVAVDGPHIDEFTDAFERNGAVAGILERQQLPGGISASAIGQEARVRKEISMNRNQNQWCGSCREVLPPSLVNSRHAVRSRHTGALLCDRCGTGTHPFNNLDPYPIRTRVPASREVLEEEVKRALGLDQIAERAKKTTPAERAAYHEAGHAVIAYQLGIPVDGVGVAEHGHGDTVLRSGDRPSIDVAAAIIAGPLAESRWCPDSPGGDESDEHALRRLLSASPFHLPVAVASCNAILELYAADVETVAEALTQRGSLTGDEVAELLDRSAEIQRFPASMPQDSAQAIIDRWQAKVRKLLAGQGVYPTPANIAAVIGPQLDDLLGLSITNPAGRSYAAGHETRG